MTYAEKLLDPRWQRKRLKILERDNFICQHCLSSTNTLHVHHLNYRSGLEPWEYEDDWLQTLCKNCHENIKTERPEFEKRLIAAFRLKLKDPFIENCAVELFEKYADLHNLMFLLWELIKYESEIDELLSNFWNKKKTELILSISNESDRDCSACGHKMRLVNNTLYICPLCGWETVNPNNPH